MSELWNSFLIFREKKRKKERYFHDKETQELFDTLLTTAKERIKSIPKGKQYWRAHLGCDEDPLYDDNGKIVDYNAIPYTVERMKPLADKAREGRINPKGIPCLYLSTDEKTAVSEVRPWVGSYVTVAQFETTKDLKIIDCSLGEIDPMNVTVTDLDKLFKLKPPSPEEAIKTVWRWIDKAFSEPVDRNDNTADYAPTQIIADLFKTNGFVGIKYRSLFNNGKNLALYDINSAEQIDSGKVIKVTRLDIDFEQIHPFIFGGQAKMSKLPERLPLRQSNDGKWEVENNPGNWIKCETKADAIILSNAPIVWHESFEAFPPDEKMAARLDRTAEKMEQYNMSFGARRFRNRAKLMRGN